jgi:SHS2 domain-containing protein
VILEAWGPDLAMCCEEAIAALVATFVGAVARGPVRELHVHLAPAAAEALLVGVLEELIFTLDTAEDVPVGARVRPAGDGGLDLVVELAGRGRVEGTGAVPKAVSRSGLRVDVRPGRVSCRFLVDL